MQREACAAACLCAAGSSTNIQTLPSSWELQLGLGHPQHLLQPLEAKPGLVPARRGQLGSWMPAPCQNRHLEDPQGRAGLCWEGDSGAHCGSSRSRGMAAEGTGELGEVAACCTLKEWLLQACTAAFGPLHCASGLGFAASLLSSCHNQRRGPQSAGRGRQPKEESTIKQWFCSVALLCCLSPSPFALLPASHHLTAPLRVPLGQTLPPGSLLLLQLGQPSGPAELP